MNVLVRGQRAPQVGVICMDLTLIDVTDIKGVQCEDEVVFFGRQGKKRSPLTIWPSSAEPSPMKSCATWGNGSQEFIYKTMTATFALKYFNVFIYFLVHLININGHREKVILRGAYQNG